MKHRGIVMSRKGMVSSAHPLISSTGINILRKGGNAIDAAVAMANTSGVVLPNMCGLGGDTFMLFYEASSKKVYALNGSGPSCEKATLDLYRKMGYMHYLPQEGIHSVTIPGFVDASFTALERFGTMKFNQLCDDAIDLAENGCPISENVHYYINLEEKKIRRYDNLKKRLSNDDGSLKKTGDLYYNKELAQTFRILAEEGKKAFYSGKIAQMIIEHSHSKGGLITAEDLAKPCCEILEPLCIDYRGFRVFQTPPVSQGIAHLEELNILNQIDFSSILSESAEAVHIMVEAKKMAFADRIRYFGDPDYNHNPIQEILSKEYAKKQADRISMDKCLTDQDLVDFDELGHTTSFVVVDKWGNAVSFITSIAGNWGSGEEVTGAGFLLNNRACAFNTNPDHPNCLKPGKRTMHTLNTYLITDQEGTLKYVGNTPGGDNQPQWNMQTIVNVIDFKLDVQSAVETAKWTHAYTRQKDGRYAYRLKIEKQIGDKVLKKLKMLGHPVMIYEPYGLTGASQIIQRLDNGVLLGGSDPRADGCAMPE